jgi:hypothetical protein
VASILAGVLALHALLTWSRYAGIARAWVWLIVALACSNVGLTVTLCAVLFALLQRGWRAAIQVAVVPALAFAGWYVGWGRSAPDGSAVSVDHPGRIAGFVWSGLTTPLSFGHHWTGVVLAVLLALVSLVSNVWGRGGSGALRRLAVAGWLAATAQLVLIALTPRLGFGDQTAGEGRYGYVTLVLVLPSVALALGLVPRRATSGGLRAVVVVAVVALICAWTVSGIPDTRQYADAQRLVSRGGPARLVALSAAVDVGERVLTPGAADPFDSWFRADLATSPGIRPDLPQGTVDPQRRVEVEAEFMTAVSTSDQHLLFHTTVTGLGFTRGIKAGAGCGRYVARGRGASLVVPSLNGVEIGFRGPATSVTTQIIRDGLGGSRTWPVTPGVSYFVATSAQVATLVITLNHAGQYHVCTG